MNPILILKLQKLTKLWNKHKPNNPHTIEVIEENNIIKHVIVTNQQRNQSSTHYSDDEIKQIINSINRCI